MTFADHSVNLFGHVFNVTAKREKTKCFDLLKKTYKAHRYNKKVEIIVVLMGGDGGLMRAMSEL